MSYDDIRASVRKLCEAFPGEYWRKLDRDMAYPQAFVDALTESGFLAALIPADYGGAGLPLSAAAAILEEIQASGCNGASCHAQMCVMGTVLRHGSEAQKQRYLPGVASGALNAVAVTDGVITMTPNAYKGIAAADTCTMTPSTATAGRLAWTYGGACLTNNYVKN